MKLDEALAKIDDLNATRVAAAPRESGRRRGVGDQVVHGRGLRLDRVEVVAHLLQRVGDGLRDVPGRGKLCLQVRDAGGQGRDGSDERGRLRADLRDGLADGGRLESAMERLSLSPTTGMMLLVPRLTLPASVALSPEEYESRIAAHAERVAREEAAIASSQRLSRKPRKPPAKLPPEMKIVSCAECSRTLLGESDEGRRDRAKTRRLPPPVAARLHGGRPYCAGCAANYQ